MIETNQNIWEEKDLTEQKTKSENSGIIVQNDITNEIKNKSVKNECEDTGNKKWKKVCPNCNKETFYTSEEQLKRSIKKNRSCRRCRSLKNNRYIGMKFGTITIIRQYNTSSPCGSKIVKVDYKCDCGYVGLNKRFGRVKRQKMCLQCKKKNKFKILPDGETSFNALYSSYAKSAKNRSLVFKLTKENFRELTKQKCFYCGTIPVTTIRPKSVGGGYTYNGIDRKNSNGGYTVENSVSCCKICNYAKLKLSVEDFLNHVKKIYEYKFVKNKV